MSYCVPYWVIFGPIASPIGLCYLLLWFPFARIGSYWLLRLTPIGSFWLKLGSYWLVWARFGSSWPLLVPFGSFGTHWSLLVRIGSFGSFWLFPFWFLFGSFCSNWPILAPTGFFRLLLAPINSALYWPLWLAVALIGSCSLLHLWLIFASVGSPQGCMVEPTLEGSNDNALRCQGSETTVLLLLVLGVVHYSCPPPTVYVPWKD